MPVLGRRGRVLAIFLPLILLVLAGQSTAAIKRTQEYDLKATFLFHFTQFVEWPSGTLHGKNSPFAIGILGDDPFGKSLDEIVANESVGGHKILVRRFRGIEQVDSCQILFISVSESGRLERILRHLSRRSILTVGDTKDFAQRAGMIGFVISQKRLRLAINLAAAREAKLTISSKLLRQSQIVGPVQVQQ